MPLMLAGCFEGQAASQTDSPTGRRSDSSVVGQSESPVLRHVDSILPLEEEVRRFRANVPEAQERLSGGARSRDALVRRWVLAIEARDSVALTAMLVNAAEYITLYYPESPYTRPPYRQSPGVRWGLMQAVSSQGATRVWQRHAGLPMGYAGYTCDPQPEEVGRNRLWTGCKLAWKNASGQGEIGLFGPIIERDGEFKFLTYASDY
jgi:hypothetical protein